MATSVAALLNGSELMYFPLQGRGESIRLALTIAEVNFVDKRLPGKLWSAEKSKTVRGVRVRRAIVRRSSPASLLLPRLTVAMGLDASTDACRRND